MRRGLIRLVVLALVAGSAGASGAGAQEPEPKPTTSTSTSTSIPPEALMAAVRLGDTTEKLLKVDVALLELQRREDVLRAELGVLDQKITDNRSMVDGLVDRVRQRAASVYARGGSGPLAPLRIDSPQDFQSGRSYADAASSVDNTLIDELARVRADLERERDRRVATQQELARSRGELVASRSQLDALRVQEQMLIDQWGAVSVMGKAQLTPAQIVAWFDSTRITPDLPAGITIADLAKLYVEEGELAGVKGDIAFAQSIIETGSFTEFEGYNFSGIGVCDSCTGGYLFDAARDGVRAQMQLLRSYADPRSRAADLPVPLSPVLYSTDPVEGARRFDTFFKRGSAPVWNSMGGGNWATDPYYAGKVLRVYARMLAQSYAS